MRKAILLDQCQQADDTAACGKFDTIISGHGWTKLTHLKPTCLQRKGCLNEASAALPRSNVKIVVRCKAYLGALLGSDSCNEFIRRKVSIWIQELSTVLSYAITHPHAAYAALHMVS